MGFQRAGVEGNRHRFSSGHPERGSVVDLVHAPDTPKGRVAVGTVHHIAFRSVSDADQLEWQKTVAGTGTDVTDVMDRQYFNSIYFHEPGGVLFEIATDPPGFTKDEEPAQLGTTLKLPPWLEPHRGRIEDVLPPLRLPKGEPA
jgi:glyoxalase family protein